MRRRRRGGEPAPDALRPLALLVPVFFLQCERGEKEGEDGSDVLTDQAHYVLIVEVVESTLCHLRDEQRVHFKTRTQH
jgi:hypothetical protein